MKIIDRSVICFPFHYLLLLLFISAICPVTRAWAQTPVPQTAKHSATFEITNDSLQAKIESINTRQGIDEALKSKVLAVYQSAQDNLANIENVKARATDYKQAIKQATEKTKRLQKEIAQTQAKLAKQEPED
ncbi:MAG: mechanosensitive ion channel domain-containing protein, partial [Methylobacter sp.]